MTGESASRIIVTSRASWSDAQGRGLRRQVASGELTRLRRGVMQPRLEALRSIPWECRPEESRLRYLDRVRAVGETRRRDVVFSHITALAIHGLPFLERWPRTVDIVEPPGSQRRSKRGVIVHRAALDQAEVIEWEGFFVTSVARTVADLARAGEAMAAVVALDHVIGSRATPLQRSTKDDVRAVLESQGPWGRARALALIGFADPRAGSPGESASRVRFAELGYEIPELQVRHPLPHGGYYETDFKWKRSRKFRPLIGEFDGLGKYLKEDQLGGLTPGEAVVKEKKREDALRAIDGSDFMRWGASEVRDPAAFKRMCDAHGVPHAPRRTK